MPARWGEGVERLDAWQPERRRTVVWVGNGWRWVRPDGLLVRDGELVGLIRRLVCVVSVAIRVPSTSSPRFVGIARHRVSATGPS